MAQELSILLGTIEQLLGWGESTGWQSSDFEQLQQRILEQTGVSLSISTLRRLWGRTTYTHLPSTTTLSTLAKFAGYDNWRHFLQQQTKGQAGTVINGQSVQPVNASRARAKKWPLVVAGFLMLAAIVFVASVAFRKKPVANVQYQLSSRVLTKDIPNSVVFSYDAAASPADSVFIQQSWDARTRTAVEKNGHVHTSVYYEPGFFQAKLLSGSNVVKELPLLIPTKGWLGVIGMKPVPVYVEQGVFLHNDRMELSAEAMQQKNVPLLPQPPMVKYYNVGNFDPVPADSFHFSAAVKNTYHEGAAACQLTNVSLITDEKPIILPLSIRGCVAELNLMAIDQVVSGKKTDLSQLGVDFSDWVHVAFTGADHRLQLSVNGRQVYTCAVAPGIHIVGMAYVFQGTGAVKNILLESNGKTVFKAF